jgi:hypothetical protein
MNFREFFIVLLMLLPSLSSAEEFRDVPEKLFGIELGGVYDLGDFDGKDLGSIPVKKFAGIKQVEGNGIHYFFHPKDEHNGVEFLEKGKNPEEQNFGTAYRLYLLPVMPSTITAIAQLEKTKLNWEVQSIGWFQKAETKEEAYNWAVVLCEKFKAEISVDPQIKDFFNSKWFECTFSSGDREYKVSNINVIRSVELFFKNEIVEAKAEAVEKRFQKLRAETIRPQ